MGRNLPGGGAEQRARLFSSAPRPWAATRPTDQASFPTGSRPPKPPLGEMVQARDLPADIDSPTLVYEDDNIRVSTISVDQFQVPPSVPMAEMPRAVAYQRPVTVARDLERF